MTPALSVLVFRDGIGRAIDRAIHYSTQRGLLLVFRDHEMGRDG